MKTYLRPLVQTGPVRPERAQSLAGGWGWFTHVEISSRDGRREVAEADSLTQAVLEPFTATRPPVSGLSFSRPRIMGILNTTPDSFSDGGRHHALEDAVAGACAMRDADLIDIGGESTRPGATTVPAEEEIRRVVPVIKVLKAKGLVTRISIDTRKAAVAEAALAAGAEIVNDVSGFTYDSALAPLCARHGAPVCVMHAQGDPQTMQQNPRYEDVVLDVYDFLAGRIAMLVDAGIPRARIIADPGIGFGKTLEQNLALLSHLSLFHGLGVPLLLGASRKGFIGKLSGGAAAPARLPGSLGVALAAIQQGVQILRVHDVPQTAQAIALWRAAVAGEADG